MILGGINHSDDLDFAALEVVLLDALSNIHESLETPGVISPTRAPARQHFLRTEAVRLARSGDLAGADIDCLRLVSEVPSPFESPSVLTSDPAITRSRASL